MFRVFISSVQADLRRQEAVERALLSWQESTSGQAIPGARGRWQLILSRLTALRAREEEDQEIVEDLERLLRDA